MDEIDVPPFFICPISLVIMRDPVTVSTGITYDRESIEKWLFSGKNTACPVTKQAISDCELVPNHTLRRLIQSWCTLNACHGIERILTPKPPIGKAQITKLLDDAKSPLQRMKCLRRLRSIASENGTNKRCIESSGAVEFLASIVSEYDLTAADEALNTLYNLQLSEAALKNLMEGMASNATLKLLVTIFPWGRNRTKATEAGNVPVLIDMLLDSSHRRSCEIILTALDKVCQCAEGRLELLSHGAGLAVVSKKILRVSQFANQKAVRILWSISKFCGTCDVVQEMMQLGIVAKLCLVLQVECGHKTKEKAREVLKLHAAAWKNSPCIPTNLLSSYPA
ncbi:E3 ubiquitin-protein ligase PUB22 [Hibiscus syriacus]|uniref:U-box domain-containing protein n=1 Tax=Hibiscus syriacus TaxID=106335 RepID=A0A6A3CHH7_HIBSY|nr:E3 ubiquitin-protein ligase PUB22 [Hibiscus syriacus]